MENLKKLMEEYFDHLTNQFIAARGIYNIQSSSDEFSKEFKEWLKQMQEIGIEYTNFLSKLRLEYRYANTAEIGKSEYDSVVAKRTKTTLITPYSQGLLNIENPLIEARFYVDDEGIPNINPIAKDYSSSLYNLIKLFWSTKYGVFMFQNPCSSQDLRGWEDLHNDGLNNIIIGVYGKTDDKDMLIKIARIKEIKAQLWGHYFDEFNVSPKRYLYVLASRPLNIRPGNTR